MKKNIRLTESKNGMKIPVIDNINIHSSYYPDKEGNKLAQKFLKQYDSRSIIVCFGLGFGFHLRYLIENRLDFCVYEPNKELVRLALEFYPNLQDVKIFSDFHRLPKNIPVQNIFLLSPEDRLYPELFQQAKKYVVSSNRRLELSNKKSVKVLIDYPIYGGSMTTAEYVRQSFENEGYYVKFVDNSAAEQLLYNILKMDESYQSMLSNKLTDLLADIFWLESEKFQPDLIIFNAQSPITEHLLQSLRKKKITTAFWFVEDFRRFGYWQSIAPLTDFFFTIQKGEFFANLQKKGLENFYYLPMAATAEIHKNISLNESERKLYGSDISFMGAGFANRHRLFLQLTDYNLKIWGNGWIENKSLQPFIGKDGERVSIEETVKIYNASKININIHSAIGNETFDEHKDFINPRTFEIAACGGFQIVDRRPVITEIFKEDENIVCFDSVAELREKIDYYLANPEKRKQIANKAQQLVHDNHTYQKRIQEMLNIIIRDSTNFFDKIKNKNQKEEDLLTRINDSEFRKFWQNLPAYEKENLDLLIEKIDENKNDFKDYEVILKILQTFVN